MSCSSSTQSTRWLAARWRATGPRAWEPGGLVLLMTGSLARQWPLGCSSSTTTTRSSTTSSSTWASSGPSPLVHRHDALDPRRDRRPRPRRRAHLARARAAPRTPASATRSSTRFAGRVPVLGVCLGHQCIGQVFGGEVVRAPEVMHGKTSLDPPRRRRACSPGCPTRSRPPATTRWSSTATSVPDVLEVTAETDDGVVMGLRHRELDVEGVQFHPESILTVGRPRPAAQLPRPGRRGSAASLSVAGRSSSATVMVAVDGPSPSALAVGAGGSWLTTVVVAGRSTARRCVRRRRSRRLQSWWSSARSADDVGRRPVGPVGHDEVTVDPGRAAVAGGGSVRMTVPRRPSSTPRATSWLEAGLAERVGRVDGSCRDVGHRRPAPAVGHDERDRRARWALGPGGRVLGDDRVAGVARRRCSGGRPVKPAALERRRRRRRRWPTTSGTVAGAGPG